MIIDWTQPVIDARDMDADPLFDSQGRVQACRVGSVVYAPPAFEKLGLRNVAPPKPEPVLLEGWVRLYAKDGHWPTATTDVYSSEEGAYDFHLRKPLAVCKIAWMSDGSPVPGEASRAEDTDGYSAEATALEIEAARDAWRTRCKQWAAKASEWAIEKDALKASLEEARQQRDDASARAEALQAEVTDLRRGELGCSGCEWGDAAVVMKPVVDAAVAWERHFSHQAAERLIEAVRAYNQSPPRKPQPKPSPTWRR